MHGIFQNKIHTIHKKHSSKLNYMVHTVHLEMVQKWSTQCHTWFVGVFLFVVCLKYTIVYGQASFQITNLRKADNDVFQQ